MTVVNDTDKYHVSVKCSSYKEYKASSKNARTTIAGMITPAGNAQSYISWSGFNAFMYPTFLFDDNGIRAVLSM